MHRTVATVPQLRSDWTYEGEVGEDKPSEHSDSDGGRIVQGQQVRVAHDVGECPAVEPGAWGWREAVCSRTPAHSPHGHTNQGGAPQRNLPQTAPESGAVAPESLEHRVPARWRGIRVTSAGVTAMKLAGCRSSGGSDATVAR